MPPIEDFLLGRAKRPGEKKRDCRPTATAVAKKQNETIVYPGGYPNAFARSPLPLGRVCRRCVALACLAPIPLGGNPGVTATELKIGSTAALSGPVSPLGTIAKCQAAYFDMVNEAGGIGERKIKFIYYDDGFNPAKTVEQVRRLIESDEVSFLFSTLGTAPNSSIAKYVNAKKVPHLFLTTNGDKWGDYETYPWSMALRAELADRGQDLRDPRPEGDAECEVRPPL